MMNTPAADRWVAWQKLRREKRVKRSRRVGLRRSGRQPRGFDNLIGRERGRLEERRDEGVQQMTVTAGALTVHNA